MSYKSSDKAHRKMFFHTNVQESKSKKKHLKKKMGKEVGAGGKVQLFKYSINPTIDNTRSQNPQTVDKQAHISTSTLVT